jgi:PST family polysaccharide transporter
MSQSSTDSTSYAGAAVHGSAWTAIQAVSNKLAAAAATIALGYLLTAEDFGVAWFAVSIGQFALVLPVVALIDVLVAAPGQFTSLARPAARLAWSVAVVQAFVIAGVGVALSSQYLERQGLAVVTALVALRPVADASYAVWLAGMRTRLEYRALALIDGAAALVSSILSVALALLGLGPVAIVLPPTIGNFVRGIMCRRHIGAVPRPGADRGDAPGLFRRFRVAGHAAYFGAALLMVEVVVLGLLAPTRSVGLLAFASGLATQVNSVISFQAAGALQPIVGHLSSSPERQVRGVLRALRLLGCVLVPALLVQAAVGGPLIRALWPSKWDEAIPIFVIASVCQAIFACYWPAVFALKAQGRFKACMNAQIVNVAAAAIVIPVAVLAGPSWVEAAAERLRVSLSPDALPAVAAALASLLLCAVFTPLMVWLVSRPIRTNVPTVLDVLFRPLVVALPAGFATQLLAQQVEQASFGGTATIVLLLSAAGLMAAVGSLGAIALSASTRADARLALGMLRSRFLGHRQHPASS